MKTILSETVQSHDRPARRDHAFSFALVALLVCVIACTAAVILTRHGSNRHSNSAPARIVGSDTYLGSVYDEQVPKAPDLPQTGSVYRQQVPPYLPFNADPGGTAATTQWQGPPYLPFDVDPNGVRAPRKQNRQQTSTGNASNVIKGLDDDSAALTVQQKAKR